MEKITFNDMENWSKTKLISTRSELRDELAEEIHRHNQLKAEILFLQQEIQRYRNESN